MRVRNHGGYINSGRFGRGVHFRSVDITMLAQVRWDICGFGECSHVADFVLFGRKLLITPSLASLWAAVANFGRHRLASEVR